VADVFSRAKRSQIMSRVRARGNERTELAFVGVLRRNGIVGWRRGVRVFGNPDFLFPKHRVAIFVDGCFWHGCPDHGTKPSSNRVFWTKKLLRNIARDRIVNSALRKRGWRVIRFWQHELLRRNELTCVRRLKRALPHSFKSGNSRGHLVHTH
jgi:DNA mismatch endonuclease, patch repair protein